jgi:cytochrome c oxidase assembly protein subunit 11
VFNVTPEAAGVHFIKVQCFCFTEQRLDPGQSVDMAVSFFVEPAFVEDEDTKGLSELTLSYTFYVAGEPQRKLGQRAANATGGGG